MTVSTRQPVNHQNGSNGANGVNGSSHEAYTISEKPLGEPRRIRVITIGAGASGLNLAHQIKTHMQEVDHIIYEKNADIGGTWFENRYPG